MASSNNLLDSCSFRSREKKECSDSRGKTAFVKLFECNKDLGNHLASCHLPRTLHEYEVILARTGYFQWNDNLVKNMVICPLHRDNLGQFWRGPTSCQYPTHAGKSKRVRDHHIINLQIAEEIMQIYGVIIQIGSRKYFIFVML